MPFVVVRREPRQPGTVALVCATNTWLAYGRRPTNEHVVAGLSSSFYSGTTPADDRSSTSGTRVPIPNVDPFGFDSMRSARMGHSHLVRPGAICGGVAAAGGFRVRDAH